MHMSDALLSPAIGAGFWAATAGLIAMAARKCGGDAEENAVPLMGVLSAFVFASQMITFAIPGTGSSGHLSGGLLLAIFLGPHRAFLAIASILVLQCLLFADGGLMALGANIFNLGFFPCYVVHPFVWKLLARKRTPARLALATMVGAVLAMELGALGVLTQTLLSGISDLPFSAFALFMFPVHAVLGAIEGAVTTGILIFVLKARPHLLSGPDTGVFRVAGNGVHGEDSRNRLKAEATP